MRRRELIGGFKQVLENGQPTTKWFDGVLVNALRSPAILDMDEIDRADPDLQYVAHQVYEGKGVTILEDEGRYIAPHPHFAMIGTANTKGRADGLNIYGLTAEMSEATRDRFSFWIAWDYMPEAVEIVRLKQAVPGLDDQSAGQIVKLANALRSSLKDGKIRTATSYRQVRTCAEYAVFLRECGRTRRAR